MTIPTTTTPITTPITTPVTDQSAPMSAAPGPPSVSLSEHTIASITELLSMCEEFLRTAGPSTHAELRTYLRRQVPPADPGWFIDMLGFNSLHLARQLPAHLTTARERWQEAAQ